jgi:hypothetical protein
MKFHTDILNLWRANTAQAYGRQKLDGSPRRIRRGGQHLCGRERMQEQLKYFHAAFCNIKTEFCIVRVLTIICLQSFGRTPF